MMLIAVRYVKSRMDERKHNWNTEKPPLGGFSEKNENNETVRQ